MKKGFTLIELIAVIVILGLILIIGTYTLSSYLMRSREKAFDVIVNSFKDSVREAYASCAADLADPDKSDFCSHHELPSYGQTDTVTLGELISEHFMENAKNPWNKDELCNPASTVIVTGASADETINSDYTYKVCLTCGTHSSDGCN